MLDVLKMPIPDIKDKAGTKNSSALPTRNNPWVEKILEEFWPAFEEFQFTKMIENAIKAEYDQEIVELINQEKTIYKYMEEEQAKKELAARDLAEKQAAQERIQMEFEDKVAQAKQSEAKKQAEIANQILLDIQLAVKLATPDNETQDSFDFKQSQSVLFSQLKTNSTTINRAANEPEEDEEIELTGVKPVQIEEIKPEIVKRSHKKGQVKKVQGRRKLTQ